MPITHRGEPSPDRCLIFAVRRQRPRHRAAFPSANDGQHQIAVWQQCRFDRRWPGGEGEARGVRVPADPDRYTAMAIEAGMR